MKKKLGDLTLKELVKICHNQVVGDCHYCCKCPLQNLIICDDPLDTLYGNLDQEIEVEENE